MIVLVVLALLVVVERSRLTVAPLPSPHLTSPRLTSTHTLCPASASASPYTSSTLQEKQMDSHVTRMRRAEEQKTSFNGKSGSGSRAESRAESRDMSREGSRGSSINSGSAEPDELWM